MITDAFSSATRVGAVGLEHAPALRSNMPIGGSRSVWQRFASRAPSVRIGAPCDGPLSRVVR